MVGALALALIPPIDSTASAGCVQNLVDIDDSIIYCSNTTTGGRPTIRLNVNQAGSVNTNNSFSFNTGGNAIVAFDDIDAGSITTSPVTFSFSQSFTFNRITISIQ